MIDRRYREPSEGWIRAFVHRYSASDRGIVRPASKGTLGIAGYVSRGKSQRVTIDHLGERHSFNGETLAWYLHFGEWPSFVVGTRNGNKRDLRKENLIIQGDSVNG